MSKILCLVFALLAASAAASDDNVVHLTESNFAETVADGKVSLGSVILQLFWRSNFQTTDFFPSLFSAALLH